MQIFPLFQYFNQVSNYCFALRIMLSESKLFQNKCVQNITTKNAKQNNRKKKKELSNFRKFDLFDNLNPINIFMTTGLPEWNQRFFQDFMRFLCQTLGEFRRFHGDNLGDLWSFKEKNRRIMTILKITGVIRVHLKIKYNYIILF